MERKRARALTALEIASGLPDDPSEALATLKLAERAYGAFLAEYGLSPNPWWKRLRSWGAIALIAAASIGSWEALPSMVVNAVSTPPFVWGEARLSVNRIRPGESLVVESSHKYLRACDWTVKREFLTLDRKLLAVSTHNVPPISVSPEFQHLRVTVPVPNLAPGDYIYRSELIGACGSEVYANPDMFEQNFSVLPKG